MRSVYRAFRAPPYLTLDEAPPFND